MVRLYSLCRRKRKWDNQGEDDAAVKKAASEADIQATADNDTGNQDDPSGPDAAAAAAAAIAAAKLNAMIVAQAKAATEGDAAAESSQTAPDSGEDTAGDGKTRGSNGVVPIREGKERDEFVADIDINDIKHRYILTKGSTQTQVMNARLTYHGRRLFYLELAIFPRSSVLTCSATSVFFFFFFFLQTAAST